MTTEQILVIAIIGAVFVLFLVEKIRYDLVAFGGLMAAVVVGLIPAQEAFVGFGHPATVTVAAVLIISRALTNAGVADFIARIIAPASGRPTTHIATLSTVGGGLSGFMNNVGALSLLMPVALQSAAKAERSPATILMPLSFGCILGGLITVIGTPPNIIIATYRQQSLGDAFSMFDFTAVGGAIAVVGIAFVALVGWRLIPAQRRDHRVPDELLDISDYVSEIRVVKDSPLVGETLRSVEDKAGEHDLIILGLVRRGKRLPGFPLSEPIRASDVLITQSGPEEMDKFTAAFGLRIAGTEDAAPLDLTSDGATLMEAVVTPASRLDGRTVGSLNLRRRFGARLIGVSREGKPYRGRLNAFHVRAGDVLLLHGESDRIADAVTSLRCLPLSERSLAFGSRNRFGISLAIFAAAIAASAFGLVALPIALGIAALALVALNVVPLRDLYDSVDWPVIILLGAMIPIGQALETTGAAQLLVEGLTERAGTVPQWLALTVILVVTMTVSDILNNAATAVIMAPIALLTAESLGAGPDAFLMAVAVGASCAFLTPIGHQNNALIMGPGGYRFGDYWRMGLPLEALIVAVAVPMLLWVWG